MEEAGTKKIKLTIFLDDAVMAVSIGIYVVPIYFL